VKHLNYVTPMPILYGLEILRIAAQRIRRPLLSIEGENEITLENTGHI